MRPSTDSGPEPIVIRWMVVVAGLVGAVGVSLGAYGAHGLERNLMKAGLAPEAVAKKLDTCEIAVRYHLIHAVALLALAVAPANVAPLPRGIAALFFLLGLAMFCGVLYAQAIAGLVGFNLVVPLGGLAFILGWIAVALTALSPAKP